MVWNRRRWSAVFADCRGSLVVNLALALPFMLLLAGGTLDLVYAMGQRQKLQSAVDAATLAAAKELGLADARRENVAAVVEAMVQASLSANLSRQALPTLVTTVRTDPLEVDVVARQVLTPLFGDRVGLIPREIEVHAVARIVGKPNICVLGLDSSAPGTISLEKDARITGQNCAVFSNSTHANGIKSKTSATLTASIICSAGGKDGGPGNFSPEPLVDCPTFDDPLADRPEPTVAACDPTLPRYVGSSRTLSPGTYCGGIDIGAGAQVTLDPGIYIIKDGLLRVSEGASLTGDGVGLFLIGTTAMLLLERNSTIDLAAPRSGSMAGLLIFEGRSQPTNIVHRILSDNARKLIGTLYFPRGRLHIDANNPVADQSAYTAIVARMLTLYGGPNLVLNTSYDETDVPVPQGIRGAAQPVSLVQ